MVDRSGAPLAFSCDCGSLCGHITESGVRTGTHLVCFCRDCRAAEIYFGQPDPAPGPVDIFQLSPDTLVFEKGQDKLALMRLDPEGLYRWYASCCNAPIATTLKSPKMAFAGFNTRRISDPDRLGPVTARAFPPGPDGKPKHEGMRRAMLDFFIRLILARLSGRWRNTPFFDTESGAPVAQAKILSEEERAALYP